MKPTMKLKVRFRTARRGNEPEPTPVRTGPSAIARRLALAHRLEALIESGVLKDYADAATRLGLTRARISQVCDLALLDPTIQAAVLLGQVEPRDRHLREVGRHQCWEVQREVFHELFPKMETEHDSRDRNRSRDQEDR